MKTGKKIKCRLYQGFTRALLPFLPYREPELLHCMDDVIHTLQKNGKRRVMLVTDKGIRSLGLTVQLENLLQKSDIACTVYDDTVANPTSDNVEEARQIYLQNHCEALIAFGGGSAMDCAKAVGARIACPDKPLAKMEGLIEVGKDIPLLVAIPTTAGTGSETTLAAVIVDSETHHKYAINDFHLIPRYAVLAPEVTVGLPKHLTATTGMDALTHAIEVYIGRSRTKETKLAAERAVKLIFENLEIAYTDGENLDARRNMLHAAYLAGTAFSKSYVGYIHAVAHSLGGQYGIPHGLANAVLLPHVLKAYGSHAEKPLAELSKAVGLSDHQASEKEAAEHIITHIEKMNARMQIPSKLKGIRKADIPTLAKHADAEGNPLYPVPVLWDAKDLEKLYDLVYDEESTIEKQNIETIISQQKHYFASGATHPYEARMDALVKLENAIKQHEREIYAALQVDLGKSETESFMCEIGLVQAEINWMKKNLKKLMKNRSVKTPLAQFASDSFQSPSPYGTVLIMSPWNYPILLTLEPLVDALAAGNTVVLKPSAYSPTTSAVIQMLLEEIYPPEYVCVVTGGRSENQALLHQHFDKIFFTGSVSVGKEVMRCASEHLTPVALELGGKSPCIVEKSCKIELAAKRIVFGKFINCGQTCVAPDYIVCDKSIHEKLVSAIQQEIVKQFGAQPLQNTDYGKIINERHYCRLLGLMDTEKIAFGGNSDASACRIEPTVMTGVTWNDAVMQEEIFGPILPILTYDDLDTVLAEIESRPRPLALYCFTENKAVKERVLSYCRFGGGCINDCIIHLATSEMPFGGVGESGMGCYHGRYGFEEFTHLRSIVDKKTWIDLDARYQPYTSEKLKLMRESMI